MSVSKAHMGKLRALYCRHSLGGAPLPPEGTPEHGAFIAATSSALISSVTGHRLAPALVCKKNTPVS